MELVVDEVDWEPPQPKLEADTIVGVRVAWQEVDLRDRVKTAGGQWNPGRRPWLLRYDRVVELSSEDRIARDSDE